MIFITTWKEDSDLEVSSTSIEEEYIVEHIVEPRTDNPRSTCEDNLISPEPIRPVLTGKATMYSATASKNKPIFTKKGSIKQGKSNTYGVSVGSGATFLEVDLNWGDKTDSLTLSSTKSGSKVVYRDKSDKKTDGRIHIIINPPKQGSMEGPWGFKIYGEKVSGTEDYTFAVYQHN